MDEINDKIYQCIKKEAKDDNVWVDIACVAKELKLTDAKVKDVVYNSDRIVVSKTSGFVTTRDMYRTKTPFMKKLMDNFQNKIN